MNYKATIPGGVALGISNVIEHLRQWAYTMYTVYTLPVNSTKTPGTTYWQVSLKEAPGHLVDLWIGFDTNFAERTVSLILVIGDKKTSENFNFERMDLRGDRHSVYTLIEEFKCTIAAYLETEKKLIPSYPPAETVKIRRITKQEVVNMVMVTFSLKDNTKQTLFMSTDQAELITRKDKFIKINGQYSHQPYSLLN